MKILYAGPFNTVGKVEHYVKHGLQKNGIEVIRANSLDHPNLQNQIDQCKPDVVLFSKPEPQNPKQLLDFCKTRKIITVCWCFDLFWGFRGYKHAQFASDLFLSTDGGHDKEINAWRNERGVTYPHITLRQGIHEPEHVIYNTNPVWDVGFVGGYGRGYHPTRKRLVLGLKSRYGRQFTHIRNVRGLGLNKKLAKIKIVVGASYPSAKYWSNRIYELTGRGTFFMCPRVEDLDGDFTDGEHCLFYERDNYEQLFLLIDKWKKLDIEREKIRAEAFLHCGANFTYEHRAKTLIEHIERYRAHVKNHTT